MQLDADKEDQPFFKPQVLQTEPLVPRTVSTSNESTTEINNPARSGQDFTEGGEQDLQSSVNSSKNDTGAHDVAATVAEATINAEQAE